MVGQAFSSVFPYDGVLGSYEYFTINLKKEKKKKRTLRANRVLYLDEEHRNHARLRGSANGLLCLFKTHRDIAACNLSTRTHISLPRICVQPPHFLRTACTLLGYDPISKQYKALKSGECVDELRNVTWKHWVFSLGVDTSWREINCPGFYFPTDSYRQSYSHTSVYINGVIYSRNWLNRDGSVPGFDIAAFDVGAETFRMIPFPDEILLNQWFSPGSALVDVDGRLAIIRVYKTGITQPIGRVLLDSYNMDIWSLEKSMKWGKARKTARIMRLATTHFGEIVMFIVTMSLFAFYCMN